jgi:hypothetical protein
MDVDRKQKRRPQSERPRLGLQAGGQFGEDFRSIMLGVGVFLDVEVLLDGPSGVGPEGPGTVPVWSGSA